MYQCDKCFWVFIRSLVDPFLERKTFINPKTLFFKNIFSYNFLNSSIVNIPCFKCTAECFSYICCWVTKLFLSVCDPQTVAHQASLFMEFSRQGYYSELLLSYSCVWVYMCMCVHVFRFFSIIGYYKYWLSFLCYTVGPCWLSVLFRVLCVC